VPVIVEVLRAIGQSFRYALRLRRPVVVIVVLIGLLFLVAAAEAAVAAPVLIYPVL
jgi:hypothetical protein